MKRLLRLPLSPSTLALLRNRSETVAGSTHPRAEVELLWGRQGNKAFREIREVLREMASGVERCVYCEDSKGIAIDHFWPKTEYPERAFDWLNYLQQGHSEFAARIEQTVRSLAAIQQHPAILSWA